MTDEQSVDRVRIDVWADIVCPACYIADNRLHSAIAVSEYGPDVDVVLHSFELHPSTADEVVDNSEVLAQMMGATVDQVEAGERRFAEVAQADGLPFAVHRKHRNTRTIHRVVKLADEYGLGAELFTRIQRRAFRGDDDAFDHETLVEVATELGVPEDRVRAVLSGDVFADDVAADRAAALALGARGVPFVVIDGRYALAGAVTERAYQDAIAHAVSEKAAP